MKKILFLIFALITSLIIKAQTGAEVNDTTWQTNYRATSTKLNDLVHTKLDVKFDFDKAYLYGKAWITLQPHFYSTDSLSLDAKGMEIKEIALVKGAANVPLKYSYDSLMLKITLDKNYKAGEKYTIYIDYVSRPNEFKAHGSAAISDAKGLYFINPRGEEKDKPTQIWTQGETEANSVWFPTIDKPNQKTTEEIYMTVPSNYVTLSNGLLKSQKKNTDGTRTDYWKMDLPHAPYLFFMGAGDFSIVKDSYKGKEVSYYVEKEYAPVVKKIFGETPAMIAFFEKVTGVPYPWPKYAQMVGRDYVSGAMENTTATLHQESAYQNSRELIDGNVWEETIAHELFHQWFGDLVTAESWSNLTVNESMADYSETLWNEFRYGKDAGDEHIEEDRRSYLSNPANASKDLVRFYYGDKEDMFDQVSYPKGGAILHMLRKYVGDSAFFKSLNKYLIDNKFKSAEAHQLRLAFEDVSGEDLSWFWNQWYFGSGHPKLNINYNYTNGNARVIVEQTQNTGKIFRLPFAIDVYNGSDKKRYNVWMKNQTDTFIFPSPVQPTWINVDAEKILLVEKTDNKSSDNFVQQFKYAANYLDRKEALNYFAKNKMSDIINGLTDKYWGLRLYTLQKIEDDTTYTIPTVLNAIEQLAERESNKRVQAKAIEILGYVSDKKYIPLFTKFASDSSYSVSGAALGGLVTLDAINSYSLAKKYSKGAKGKLGNIVLNVMITNGTEEDFDIVADQYKNSRNDQQKVQLSSDFADYLVKIKDENKVRQGVDLIMTFRSFIPEQYRSYIDPAFKQIFGKLNKSKSEQGQKELADFISGLIK